MPGATSSLAKPTLRSEVSCATASVEEASEAWDAQLPSLLRRMHVVKDLSSCHGSKVLAGGWDEGPRSLWGLAR